MNLPPQNLLYPIDTWTKHDVKKWFEYCIEEYSLGNINLNDFQMNGKALLLLNEDGFKQRTNRSGDILYKALQKHHVLIKSLTCQPPIYSFWNDFSFTPTSYHRQLTYPYSSTFMSSMFNHKYPTPIESDQTIRTRQISTSSSSSIVTPIDTSIKDEKDSTTQIRYYKDRVDFHGEILMKPKAAINCRILWEFLYILLEDPDYQSIILWENREKMIFRIIQADKLAALWGLQKNRLSMTYEKLSRGMRYYYSNNIITKEQSKRLLYRFMRSPDEIRQNMKRSSSSSLDKQQPSSSRSNPYLPLYSVSISKSDRSSSSSPESENSEKLLSTKRKQTYSISLTDRLSQNSSSNQPLNLVLPKQKHFLNYKKQKFLYTIEQ